ncbi:MAG: hypothetical protein QOE70_5400 [Chthoniobacter sp.]|jgi:hypothetical protein|nr:hypothetical protein [Chthoniobacter sp.]
MIEGVNVMLPPAGYRVVRNGDDASVKAEAQRLGVLTALNTQLNARAGQRAAAALARDGDRLVAILAWAGFESNVDNGWASLAVTPACDATADWLVAVAHQIIDVADVQMLEGDLRSHATQDGENW